MFGSQVDSPHVAFCSSAFRSAPFTDVDGCPPCARDLGNQLTAGWRPRSVPVPVECPAADHHRGSLLRREVIRARSMSLNAEVPVRAGQPPATEGSGAASSAEYLAHPPAPGGALRWPTRHGAARSPHPRGDICTTEALPQASQQSQPVAAARALVDCLDGPAAGMRG